MRAGSKPFKHFLFEFRSERFGLDCLHMIKVIAEREKTYTRRREAERQIALR